MTGFRIYGEEIRVKEGEVRNPEPAAAGTILMMNRAAKIVNELVGVSLDKAMAMTINPAAVMEIDHQKERLEPGRDPDSVICDHELNARKVKAGRRLVYEMQN